MKSINQIFQNDKKLLSNPAVQELVEYCYELENDFISNKQSSAFTYEVKLAELTRDIYSSIVETLKDDDEAKRFGELTRVDYEESLRNLKKYLKKFSIDNNFRL